MTQKIEADKRSIQELIKQISTKLQKLEKSISKSETEDTSQDVTSDGDSSYDSSCLENPCFPVTARFMPHGFCLLLRDSPYYEQVLGQTALDSNFAAASEKFRAHQHVEHNDLRERLDDILVPSNAPTML